MPEETTASRQNCPIVFIGLGSTGAKIVSQIRALIWAEGADEIKDWTNFTAITSERNPEPGVSTDVELIPMSSQSLKTSVVIDNFVNHHTNKAMRDQSRRWWPSSDGTAGPQPDGDWSAYYPEFPMFDEGCAGFRPAGRLLFHHANLFKRLQGIQTSFERKLASMQQRYPAKAASFNTDHFYCYVFGLLAGGTCSGMVVDFAMLLRAAIPNARITGSFLLGDVCYTGVDFAHHQPIREKVQKLNTLLALAELFATHSLAGREITYPEWLRLVGADGQIPETFFKQLTPAYDELALVGARRQNGHFLCSFEAYQHLLAQYYGRLFLTHTHAQEAGRWVDDTEQTRSQLDRDRKTRARANNVRLISYLSLTLPKRKTTALALAKIVDDIDHSFFRNSDQQRRDTALAKFRNAVAWHDLDQFQPEDEHFIPSAENDDLPDTAADFKRKWETIRNQIREHYQLWHKLQGPAHDRQDRWETTVREAFAELLDDLTGCTTAPIALGTLKETLETLDAELNGLSTDLTRRADELNQSLFADKDGRETIFEAELAAKAGNFPKKGIFSGRRSWTGQNEVRQSLSAFREELRALCTVTCANAALAHLQNYVRLVATVRRLIVKRAVYPIFDACRTEGQAVFLVSDRGKDVEQEILGDRADIERILLPDVLDGPATVGSKTQVRQALTDRFASRVREGTAGRNLSQLFQDTVANLARNPAFATTHDSAWEIPTVQRSLSDFRNGLTGNIGQARKTIQETIGQISVWDALRKVAERSGNAVAMIENQFRTYGAMSQLFTKLGGTSARYGVSYFHRTFICLCDVDAAARCFSALGIQEPDYLTRLFRNLGFSISPEIRNCRGLNEIVLFNSERAHEMRDFEEFMDLNLILAQPGVQVTDIFRWSDIRFPSWLEKLHQEEMKAQG